MPTEMVDSKNPSKIIKVRDRDIERFRNEGFILKSEKKVEEKKPIEEKKPVEKPTLKKNTKYSR